MPKNGDHMGIDYKKLSEETGLKYKTLHRRIHYLKWDYNIAIETPLTTPRAYKKILRKKNDSITTHRARD